MDSVPEWLNRNFLANCLQGSTSFPVDVKSFDVSEGVAPGNNYGSVIMRVKVKYREENSDQDSHVSLIVKAPVSNSAVDAMIELFGMAEYNFYYLYLPKLNKVIEDCITPKAYQTSINSVIVLEDLKESGFTMADRQKQLDFDHCKQYFTASAKFHAAGVVIANQNPDLVEKFPSIFDKMTKGGDISTVEVFMHDIFVGMKCLIKAVQELNLDEYKPYVETIRKFVEFNVNADKNMREQGLKAMAEKNKLLFKSFIHGDCWTTNMMFQLKSGRPTDIRMVDFQGFRYDSVVSDLINFTWMSCDNEVLEHHLDELYHLYCDTLNSKLEEFGCSERLSFQRLKEEICISSFQVLSMVSMMLPITLHDELLDTSKMFTGVITEEDIIKFYQGEHFLRKFPMVLKFVADQEIFSHIEKEMSLLEQLKGLTL